MPKGYYARAPGRVKDMRAFTIRVTPELYEKVSDRAFENKRSVAGQIEIELERIFHDTGTDIQSD